MSEEPDIQAKLHEMIAAHERMIIESQNQMETIIQKASERFASVLNEKPPQMQQKPALQIPELPVLEGKAEVSWLRLDDGDEVMVLNKNAALSIFNLLDAIEKTIVILQGSLTKAH